MKNRKLSKAAPAAVLAALGVAAMAHAAGPAPATASQGSSGGVAQKVSFKPGTFTGKRVYAYYGYLKVQATVQNGRLTDVRAVEYPNDNGRSHFINSIAIPYLVQEAIQSQSYKVDLISGVTFTSVAFVKSLQDALQAAGG